MNFHPFRSLWTGMVPAIVLWLLLATRSVGHLLLWDEAMQLCTLRSFLTGDDFFSLWFWRHPPLMSLVMFLCDPYSPGFDLRVEFLVIGFGAVNIGLLHRLTQRLHGDRTALWVSLVYALLPGQHLLGVWIKTDHMVITFGLLALLLLEQRRIVGAAILLGLALLTKETGIFFLGASFLALATSSGPTRSFRNLACLTLIPLAMISIWYLGFDTGLQPAVGENPATVAKIPHLVFAFVITDWAAAWWQYFVELPQLLGVAGTGLSVVGVGTLVYQWCRPGLGRLEATTRQIRLWPLFLLFPSYLILSIVVSKVPWIVLALLPAWATLIGVTFAHLEQQSTNYLSGPIVRLLAPMLFVTVATVVCANTPYEERLDGLVPQHMIGAARSREIATTLDQQVKPDDTILLSSFHYWKGLSPNSPCAVFTYYSQAARHCTFILCDSQDGFGALQSQIMQHDVDWAVLSPPPGDREVEVFGGFERIYGAPIPCQGAFIFRTNTNGNTRPD